MMSCVDSVCLFANQLSFIGEEAAVSPKTGNKNRRLKASMPNAHAPTGRANGSRRLSYPAQGPEATAHRPVRQPAKAPKTPTMLAARPVAFDGGRTANMAHRAAVAAKMPMAVINRNMAARVPTPARF